MSVPAEAELGLQGEATIFVAAELKEHLQQQIAAGAKAISLKGLTALDGAGAQLLLAARRSHPDLRFTSCPEPIRERLALVGLDALIIGGEER